METIHQTELDKRVKLNELEAFTPEQVKIYAEENLALSKEEGANKDDIMKSVADEIRTFTPFKVIGSDHEGHVTEKIMMVRAAQIEWDEPTDDISKARSGTYKNTPENVKLGRVGKRYGESKGEDNKKDPTEGMTNLQKAAYHRDKMAECNKKGDGAKYHYHLAKRDMYKELAKKEYSGEKEEQEEGTVSKEKLAEMQKENDMQGKQLKEILANQNKKGITSLPEKGSADWHQLQVAKKTLNMDSAMSGVMGGMSHKEAKEVLAKYGIKE